MGKIDGPVKDGRSTEPLRAGKAVPKEAEVDECETKLTHA